MNLQLLIIIPHPPCKPGTSFCRYLIRQMDWLGRWDKIVYSCHHWNSTTDTKMPSGYMWGFQHQPIFFICHLPSWDPTEQFPVVFAVTNTVKTRSVTVRMRAGIGNNSAFGHGCFLIWYQSNSLSNDWGSWLLQWSQGIGHTREAAILWWVCLSSIVFTKVNTFHMEFVLLQLLTLWSYNLYSYSGHSQSFILVWSHPMDRRTSQGVLQVKSDENQMRWDKDK